MLSRVFLLKSDKVTITAWKLDLYRILHIFNVRSVAFAWSRLTVRFQTELVTNTNVVVSKICHDIMKSDTYTTKSDIYAIEPYPINAMKSDTNATKSYPNIIRSDTAVLGTRRTVARSRRGTVNKKRQVSVTCTLSITEQTLTTPQTQVRLALPSIMGSIVSLFYIAPLLVNPHPHRRGPVLDVTS